MKISRNPFEFYSQPGGRKKTKNLEWEESALNSQVEGFAEENRPVPALRWPKILLICFFVLLVSRIFYLQIIQGPKFRALSEGNRIRSQAILAPRGLIKDRNGEILAQNAAGYNLVVVPSDLPKTNLDDEIGKLALLVDMDSQEIKNKVSGLDRNSFQPVVLKQDIPAEQNILFETRSSEFIGFDVEKTPIRNYIDGSVFSHVLGYTGLISQGEYSQVNKDLYDYNDDIGKLGVEAQYEKFLHGTNGQLQVEVDASGKLSAVLGQEDPLPGDTLVLNIDKGLQEELYQDLSNNNPNRKAAAVAINPKTGEVLALVSLPGFDNNLFAHGIKLEDYDKLLNDPNHPMINRAISGTYPPGSTSKLMTATAGLQEGVINQNTVIVDNGVITVPNQYGGPSYLFHGWKPGGLGAMTVRSAIALSSDIFFYEVAGGPPNGSWNGLGPTKLAQYFRKFGLGKPLGIDLPGEKGGLVPDPAWKMQYYNNDPLQGKWYLGDTYHMGIGQGDLLVTPLQVAEWTSIVANGGVGYVPEVAKQAVNSDGKVDWQNQPKVLVSNIASAENIKIVQEGMRQTVTAGTAKALLTLPITSAGKTGTSQFDGSDPNKTHAWFTAYAPYEDPQIVVTVLVEAGGEGNAVSEPVVKDALDWWAKNRYKK